MSLTSVRRFGEAGVHFLAEACYLDFDAGDLGFIIGDVTGESSKSPFDQPFQSIKSFIVGFRHLFSIHRKVTK
jgi:hypothetical protein